MIVPDVNLLIYAYHEDAPLHGKARRWWESLFGGAERVGVPWAVSLGFMRLMTNRRMLERPMPPERAADCVREWFRYPHVAPLHPGPEHPALLREQLAHAGAGGSLVADAHIAAIAIEYGAEVHSNDADFARFHGLRWRNPL